MFELDLSRGSNKKLYEGCEFEIRNGKLIVVNDQELFATKIVLANLEKLLSEVEDEEVVVARDFPWIFFVIVPMLRKKFRVIGFKERNGEIVYPFSSQFYPVEEIGIE